jgi:hypothetical protein
MHDHGVSLQFEAFEQPGTYRHPRGGVTTLELKAKNPLQLGEMAILAGLGGLCAHMASTALRLPGSGGAELGAAMAMMSLLAAGLIVFLVGERTALSLTPNALRVRSGVVGTRRLCEISRSEIASVELDFEQGWGIVAVLRDGDRVSLARLTYPEQATAIRDALRRALRGC